MGGKGGHMLHPYEDPELTFQSLMDLFEAVPLGGLEGTIKRDGQNLVVSYSLARDAAVAIRNDDHVYAKGLGLQGSGPKENLADYLALEDPKFASWRKGRGRNKRPTPPHIIKAFSKALRELENVARQMPEDVVRQVFGDDADIFYNAEVMDPISRNAIEYDVDTLSIHRILHHKYDEEKRDLDTMGAKESGKRAELLNQALAEFYAANNTTYDPQDPRTTPPVSVGAKVPLIPQEHLVDIIKMKIDKIAQDEIKAIYTKANLSANSTMGQLVFKAFRQAVEKQLPQIGEMAQKKLMVRMFQEAYTEKVYDKINDEDSIIQDFGIDGDAINEGKINLKVIGRLSLDQSPEVLTKIRQLADSAKAIQAEALGGVVKTIYEFSARALGALRDLYVLNRDDEIERTRSAVLKTIANLETLLDPAGADDPQAQAKWEKFLAQRDKFKKLEDKISEAEGFVFQWPPGSDNTYKFTGLFAPINQLLGMDPSRWAEGLVYTETLLTEGNNSGTVLYLPGGFKPPHKGHFALARDALSQYPGAQLVIMSGESARGNITLDKARNVWDSYFKSIGEEKNVVVRALEPEYPRDADGNRMRKHVRGAGVRNPMPYSEWIAINLKDSDLSEANMKALYERAIGVPKSGTKSAVLDDSGNPITVEFMTTSPINSIASAIRFKDKPERAIIVASAEDPGNATTLAQSLQGQGLPVEPLIIPVRVKDESGGSKMSATQMRKAVQENDFETFKLFLPVSYNDNEEAALEIFSMLGGVLGETVASMGGGAISGPGGGHKLRRRKQRHEGWAEKARGMATDAVSPILDKVSAGLSVGRKEDEKDEEEELVNEVADYLLGITVG